MIYLVKTSFKNKDGIMFSGRLKDILQTEDNNLRQKYKNVGRKSRFKNPMAGFKYNVK